MNRAGNSITKSQYLAEATASARIVNYNSYREYLHDVYNSIKNLFTNYSYIQYGKDLGFTGSNHMRSVIKGTRSLTDKSALKVADNLALKGKERAFFKLLVSVENESNQGRKSALYKKLLNIKAQILPMAVDPILIKYFSEWHFPVIKELIALHNGQLCVEDIQGLIQIPISKKKVFEGIKVLQEVGFITSKEGKLFVQQAVVKIPHDTQSLALTNFHLDMLDRSKEALVSLGTNDREYLAATVSLGSKGFALLKQKLRDLVSEALVLEEEDESQLDRRVVQVNLNIFKISKEDADD